MTSNPYDTLPPVPDLQLTSTAFSDGGRLPAAHFAAATGLDGAADSSPPVAWSHGPAGTKSYVVTMFDPDAPTPSGFWHWIVTDVPDSITELPGNASAALPGGAAHAPNDMRIAGYVGAAPPPGSGAHRYVIAVHALDVASVAELGFDLDGTPAGLSFAMLGHTTARGTITAHGEA